jgi:hypothetical protein
MIDAYSAPRLEGTSMTPRRLLCALLLLAFIPITAQQAAPSAQTAPLAPPAKRPNIPDTFTNLTVLPATITKPELMGIMKQFSITMKVRCAACHAVSDDLSEGSFASDDKPMKADARKLMHLLQQTAPPLKP